MEDINYLDGQMALPKGALESLQSDLKEVEQAVAILESYPRWQPLIEAAGKVDKKAAIRAIDENPDGHIRPTRIAIEQIRSLLAALPEAPDA